MLANTIIRDLPRLRDSDAISRDKYLQARGKNWVWGKSTIRSYPSFQAVLSIR
jgi:hypothetical protein